MVLLPNYWIVNCCFSIKLRHMEYIKDGLKHMQLKFYIEGSEPGLKGTVLSESKEVVLFLKVQFLNWTNIHKYAKGFERFHMWLQTLIVKKMMLLWNVYFICQVQKHFLTPLFPAESWNWKVWVPLHICGHRYLPKTDYHRRRQPMRKLIMSLYEKNIVFL